MSQTQSNPTKAVKVVRLDFSELYGFGGTEESAVALLLKILEHYGLKPDILVGVSPDFGNYYVQGIDDEDVDEAEDIEKLLMDRCLMVVVLNDGYETAYACI
jgi:hypothetical protein